MWWGLLFGVLFFVPVFGIAIGAGIGALMGKVTKSGIDKEFQDQVRGMVQPGTSALFLMVEKVTPDKAIEALSKYGGTVLKTSLSKEGEKELQDALHGKVRGNDWAVPTAGSWRWVRPTAAGDQPGRHRAESGRTHLPVSVTSR